MKVLLTGASGFIGRFCLEQLLAAGHEVIPIVYRQPNGKVAGEKHSVDLLNQGARYHLLDLVKPEYLLHLAWNVKPGYRDATHNIDWLYASFDLVDRFYLMGGTRAVTVGTCFEYDLSDQRYDQFKEYYSIQRPSTFYGITKNSLWHLLNKYAQNHSYSYAHARLFYQYGPYEHPSRIVPIIINGILHNKPLALAPATQLRDFLYVEDVASALIAILFSKVSGAINIGSGVGTELGSLATRIQWLMQASDKDMGLGKYKDQEPSSVIADTQILNNMVGWSPKFALDEALTKTIKFWEQYQNG